jgi:integrase
VTLYVSEMAKPLKAEDGRKAATILRRIAAINDAHMEQEFTAPGKMNDAELSAALKRVRWKLGTAQKMKKPLTLSKIEKMLDALVVPIAAARDKVLLLIGFAGGMRREELAALRLEHLTSHSKGYTIWVPKSKNEQEGKGRKVEILYGKHERTCPVLALENWIKVANIKDGFVLRSVGFYGSIGEKLDKDSIGRIVQRCAERAGIANPEDYGGHSLRAGFVTQASANGAIEWKIMRQTGHRSREMIDRYSREGETDRQAAVSRLGL